MSCQQRPLSDHRQLRLPLRLPHRRPRLLRRRGRVALPPPLRLAQRLRGPARPRRRPLQGCKPRGVIVPISRRYEPGTLVIETTWVTDTGWVVVHDALTIAEWATAGGKARPPRHRPRVRPLAAADDDLHRRRGRDGDGVPAALRLRARRRRAGAAASSAKRSPGADDGTELRLTSDMELTIEGGTARGTLKLREDETGFCAVTWGDGDLGGPRSAPEALERLDSTEEFWRDWLRDGNFPDHPWRIHLQRSALVLKGLTYTPTGAIVAAPTTSLPETPGGERNWDYRFSWIRDSTFSLWALHTLGFDQEARDFMRFIVDVCQDHPDLQIMYGIGAREGADREDARPPRRLRRGEAGADRQRRLRPAPERRLGRAARLDLPARKSAQRARHAGRPRADPLPGGSGDRGLAPARPGDLGVARRAPALRLLEADDLGRGRPRRPPRPQHRLRGAGRASGRRRPTRSRPRSSSAASATASSASTTRPTPSTPRCC